MFGMIVQELRDLWPELWPIFMAGGFLTIVGVSTKISDSIAAKKKLEEKLNQDLHNGKQKLH